MALLQFAKEFYGVAIPNRYPKLTEWYERFSKRPSVPQCTYPPEMLSLAYGLPEQTQYTL